VVLGSRGVHGTMGDVDDHPQDRQSPEKSPGTSKASGDNGTGISDELRAQRLAELQSLMELMRPAVQADGGDLVLVSADVESGVVEVQLQGACSSCAISSATLQGGVERILKGRLSWVTEVVGGLTETADPLESALLGRGGYVPRV
jgi:Fe-S cluster biogenesis protein NfuA